MDNWTIELSNQMADFDLADPQSQISLQQVKHFGVSPQVHDQGEC